MQNAKDTLLTLEGSTVMVIVISYLDSICHELTEHFSLSKKGLKMSKSWDHLKIWAAMKKSFTQSLWLSSLHNLAHICSFNKSPTINWFLFCKNHWKLYLLPILKVEKFEKTDTVYPHAQYSNEDMCSPLSSLFTQPQVEYIDCQWQPDW